MNTIMEPAKEIPVLYKADVVVVGGGPAGIGAALASGRNGARTILVDRFGSLGGLQTQGQNPIFSFVDPELHSGIIQDILDRLGEAGAMKNLEKVPGFENSFIERTPAIACARGGHTIIGDYVLTVGDMREGKIFDDSVAINNMPSDLYESVGRFAYDILPHDVPYRSLVSRDIDNLMAAGTTISCGSFANAGMRYCTPSVCTGQAAGTAAVMAVANNVSPKNLDVQSLQDALRKQGARVSVRDLSQDILAPYQAIQKMKLVFKRTEDI